MKIEKVTIKDFKAIKSFEAEPKGQNILLIGENGVGKSSVIQFLEIALGKQSNVPPQATGEGVVIVNRNGQEYTFRVEFRQGKPVVTVTTPDGLSDARKGTIAGIVGAIDFDIEEFVELSKSDAGRKKQIEIFKKFLEPETQKLLASFEENVRINYEQRTYENRKSKEIDGFIKQHPLKNEVNVPEPPNTSDLWDKIEAANKVNSSIETVKSGIKFKTSQSEALKKQIEELTAQHNVLVNEVAAGEKWLTAHSERDVEPLKKALSESEELQGKYKSWLELQKMIADKKASDDAAGEMTALIESSREAIRDAVRDMGGPIEGLTFDSDSLFYNGIAVNPDSLSTSEIMELGVRLKMAENPEFGILFIQRGESLGTDRLNTIKEIAERGNFQIIMEQVERGNTELTVEIMA